MAYAPRRSMNGDLHEGVTDGKYKKVHSFERGGFVEPTTQEARKDLHDLYFGIHEINPKVMQDGRSCPTPQYVPTAPVGDYI